MYELKLLYKLLLKRYHDSHPSFQNDSLIPYEKVEVLGWPNDIVFYDHITTSDHQNLCENLPKLIYVRDWRQFDPLSKVQLMELVSFKLTKSPKFYWTEFFKRFCPSVHLTSPDPSLWNAKDAFIVRKIFAVYEANVEEAETLKIQERIIFIMGKLTQKYNDLFGTTDLKINWMKVEVIGWPKNIKSFTSTSWTDDCLLSLEANIENISFAPKQLETENPSIMSALVPFSTSNINSSSSKSSVQALNDTRNYPNIASSA